MTIQKYEGKTKEEAIEKAKAELGDAVVIMNVKKVRPGGVFGIFQSGSVEVTVAIEDDLLSRKQPTSSSVRSAIETLSSPKGFDAVADEPISIPPVGVEPIRPLYTEPVKNEPVYREPVKTDSAISATERYSRHSTQEKEPAQQSQSIDAEALRSVFKEVGEVIGKDRTIPVSSVSGYDPESKLIKADQIKSQPKEPEKITPFPRTKLLTSDRNTSFIRILYNNLIEHEVDEHYVNSLLSDLGNLIRNDVGMDFLISNVYQKMILQIGHPATININKRPKVVFLIGPTGVGKTTTIAKLASRFKLTDGRKAAFITSDTYRIGAEEQLATYANILKIPIDVLYDPQDLPGLVGKYSDYDVVLVDTVGFSHKNTEQRDGLRHLLEALPQKYDRDIFLVLSATTKYRDLKRIVDEYKAFTEFALIFTKLDETDCYGNLYNIRKYAGAPLSYITTGQKVPEDISVVDSQKLVKNLLGGN